MPRGRKPTCECGTCKKCRRRAYQREYQRRWALKHPLTEEQKQRKREAAARWREENPERARENARRSQRSDARREYMRVYREENRERLNAADLARYHASDKKKARARGRVSDAIRRGKLTRGSCEVCGRDDAHAHHDDYDKPLDVRWLCPQHHADHHLTIT